MHLVRNSLDHGLEPPQERVAAGKAPAGKLTLSARHETGAIPVSYTHLDVYKRQMSGFL